MIHRYSIEAVDLTLRDIMVSENKAYSDIPFGNKNFAFAGDFRQILPVMPIWLRIEIGISCFKKSTEFLRWI